MLRLRFWRSSTGARILALSAAVVLVGPVTLGGASAAVQLTADQSTGTDVLTVGTYNGIPGQFANIQAALDAAKPGDWVLVGPGDYKTSSWSAPPGEPGMPAGLLMTTPGVWLRGMDRSKVIVDGTKPGSPPCSSKASDQNYGPSDGSGLLGLNGIEVWKADDVWVQNLTVCNFLAGGGGGETGNEIWWNGGADSGKIGGFGYGGSYLSATSTYYGGEGTAAQYGIFSSNWSGGTWDQTYASNFNDSGYYIGACQQECDQTVDHAWAEYNALGYSGSNSGGQLVVENSQFDQNEDGFDTNSQNGDNPPPQNGACPDGGTSPITRTHSCWVFMHNYVHDNNNPDVPSAGSAAAGPVGTGMSLSGARNDTVVDNTFVHNGAWGTILVPYPDSGDPCTGGTQTGAACLYDEYGDALIDNSYGSNGFFANPTNGDFAAVNLEPDPTDCFSGNSDVGLGTATSSPPYLQLLYPTCNGETTPPDLNPVFLDQVACDSQSASIGPVSGSSFCLPGTNYPRRTQVVMHPLPHGLLTMADPCSGVPVNRWCPASTGQRARAYVGGGGRDSLRSIGAGPGASTPPGPSRRRGFRRV